MLIITEKLQAVYLNCQICGNPFAANKNVDPFQCIKGEGVLILRWSELLFAPGITVQVGIFGTG